MAAKKKTTVRGPQSDPMFPSPAKKKPAAKKAPDRKGILNVPGMKPSLSKQENAVFKDMSRTIKREGKDKPKQLKKDIQRVVEDQYKENALTGMAHPDVQALKQAGISEATIAKLVKQYAPDHPAAQPSIPAGSPAQIAARQAGVSGPNAGVAPTDTPTTPAQYAADVLLQANLPNTLSNEQLLEDQMTVEGMPGGENNPLATSLKEPGSSSVNSAGVQQYPNLYEGASAEAATLQQGNMASIYKALQSGTASPQDYAKALAASAYEGYDPAANAAYANSFLQDAGQPTLTFPGGGASGGGGGGGGGGGSSVLAGFSPSNASGALNQAMSSNAFAGLNSVIPQLGTQGSNQSLQSVLAGLSSSPEAQTLMANTANAPGSPDQPASQSQQTNVNPAASYEAQLAALLGQHLQAGSAGKGQ